MMQDILTSLIVNAVVFTVLFGILMLVRRLLGKRISAVLQYALWAVVVIKLFIPFGFESSLSPLGIFAASDNPAASNTHQNTAAAYMPPDDSSAVVPAEIETGINNEETPTRVSEQTTDKNETAALTSANTEGVQAMSINWTAVLFALWAAGALTAGMITALDAIRMRRRIRRERTLPSLRVMRIFEECKHELGLRTHVGVLIQSSLSVPLVMSAARPKLVLPDDIETQDDEQIRHICMHELTHVRYGDLAVIAVLNVLGAIYWFNPFTWLCFRLIRKDMEVVCDCRVLEKLGRRARRDYIGTVLKFAGREDERRQYAAMGMADGRLTMEQRIRGMFKASRTGVKSRVVAITIAMLMLAVCVLTACQPTPEKPIVQAKDNDSVQQAIESSASETHTYSAPERWQSEAHDEVKNINLYVDAEVDVPTDTWGIYELVSSTMTEADLQSMLDAIVGDATIYGEQTIRSKEYLMEQITHLESQKKEFERLLNEGGLSEDEKLAQEAAGNDKSAPQPSGEEGPESLSMLSEEDLKRNIESFTSMINEAKAKLTTAPDEDTVVQHEFVLADMFKEDMTEEQALESGFSYGNDGYNIMKSLSGTADLGRETPADIYIQLHNNGEFRHFSIYYADYDDYEQSFGGNDELYTGQELFKCDIGMEEAAQIARDKVSEMGYGYLDIDTTYVSGMLDRQRKEGDKFPECFEFVFTRAMDGATATYAHGDGVWTEEKELALEYAPHWNAGEVKVYVDDSGVIGIRVETLKSDVTRQAYGIELKDFEEIMDIFETQLFINNAYSGPGDWEKVLGREIRVKEIRLGYMPTAWKDHSGKIIFTPVWDFFGEEVVTFEDGIKGDLGTFLDENNRFYMDLGSQSLLTINALDGTIMVRQ